MKIKDIPAPWFEMKGHTWRSLIGKWHLGYYDGPLTGIAIDADSETEAEWYFVACPWELDRGVWCAWKLTPEEKAYEFARHEAFRQHVGEHTDYDDSGERTLFKALKPESERPKFYDDPRWKQERRYQDRDFDAVCTNPF